MQCSIDLSEQQVRGLRRMSARERRSVDELVGLAVSDYLARRERTRADWGARVDEVVAAFRDGIPSDVTGPQIEAEITAVRAAYRATRARRRRAHPGSG